MDKKTSLLSHFPRTSDLPTQSPKYWTKEKDRYLRQLLISDIQDLTGRELVVFFSQLDQAISAVDPDDISEIMSGLKTRDIDILIQTPGGDVDATEKIVAVLNNHVDRYRVLVPSWAKSAGTVIAISSTEIVMGVNSELGPIDPQFQINTGMFPAELLAKDEEAFPQHVRDYFANAVKRTRAMAKNFLKRGMLAGQSDEDIDAVLKKISETDGYMSHGAVIDQAEASDLGLKVLYLEPDDDLWRRLWLLYCMYDYDMKQKSLGKVFESMNYSIGRPSS